MIQDYLIRALALLAAVVVIAMSVAYLTQRRQHFGTHTITGIFLFASGIALLLEAATLIGEFIIVGGVMLVFAGLAGISSNYQNRDS